ncbi:MAG: flagellar protein FlbB [Xanthobacteraceae bacterium]|nr:flagellar protein FlbB [Xanthobacteraceae bacterium]
MRFRGFRLLPLVLAAIIGLVVLKTMGLVLEGGYIFTDREVAPPPKPASWARQMFNFPSGSGGASPADPADITGSVEEKKEAAKPEGKAEAKPEAKSEGKDKAPESKEAAKPAEGGRPVDLSALAQPGGGVSASERAILERLAERRQELDARAREIDIRENLLKAAEKRIESKVSEMKAVEARIGSATEKKGQADADRFKDLVTMYESMKPKDAAKIFDRLEMAVLIQVASKIAPRKMSDIVGLMQPEAAERLTVELARRAGGDPTSPSNLPKIDGRPTGEETN